MEIKYEKVDYSGKIVTLCGSYRFMEYFDMLRIELVLKGNLVLAPEFEFTTHKCFEKLTEEQINILHNIHYAKMRKSDRIVIVAPYGYIGEDTEREIRYANLIGKQVDYMLFEDYDLEPSNLSRHESIDDDMIYIPEQNRIEQLKDINLVIRNIKNF